MGDKKGEPAGPCVVVVFGATGDLNKRKLLPAIYNLQQSGLLPEAFAVLGAARKPESTESFRRQMREEIGKYATQKIDEARWAWLEERLQYQPVDYHDPASFETLAKVLARIDEERGTGGNYLFYLATPPSVFAKVVSSLKSVGLVDETEGRWRRVIVEKPFGHDLDSAVSLNAELRAILDERQIYRIDHYLGKETVQNILLFRFANGIFEPIWNRRYVDHVQITVGEDVGVEQRASYYEEAGALRDMVQNHLFQLLALTAMEPPTSFEDEAVRDEKSKILRAIKPMKPEDVLTRTVRGQYGEGAFEGERAPGYRQEPNVDPASKTDTFVALKLSIDNWRWAEVPFYLRTGKRLAKRCTEIVIQFKRAPHMLFEGTHVGHVPRNTLILHLQPNEGISLSFQAKIPGPVVRSGEVQMRFDYADYFGSTLSTGYETLLYDCVCGDATLFQRSDNVEAGWKVVTPILDVWRALPAREFPNYAAGSWGPSDADALLERDGRHWRNT